MEYQIETERLLLQPMSEADIGFIQGLVSRPESYRYESDHAKTNDEIENRCRWFIGGVHSLPDKGAIRWIVKCNGAGIGGIHVTCNWEETNEWEIGYAFLSEYWGQGFASEAVKAVIRYVFAHFKINRLAAFINAENHRSTALAERVGMVLEGRIREVRLIHGVYVDEYVYSVLKRDINREL